jgi:hypothetical protein
MEPPPADPAPVDEPVLEAGHASEPEPAPLASGPADPPEADEDDQLGDTEPHGFAAVEDDDASDADDLLGAEDEDLDVLEDTPDFLQETPEHDRLWFEQKPPRDFDFD